MKHEFYADPTVFDQWQTSSGRWVNVYYEKLSPYLWSNAFAFLSVVFALISLAVLGHLLFSEPALSAQQQLAHMIMFCMAIFAAQRLLIAAKVAWPSPVVGWGARSEAVLTARVQHLPLQPVDSEQQQTSAPGARDIQAFFQGARAAGVNVAIAKALFAAGVRSAAQLRGAEDAQLLKIRGVGPATVRKLRAQFG